MLFKKEEKLYKIIIDNSCNLKIGDYFIFLSDNVDKLEKNIILKNKLLDNVLKRILNNLKNNVDISIYDIIVDNMNRIDKQFAYDLTIKIIKMYYENNFVINNIHYSVLDIISIIIKNNMIYHDYIETTSNILHNLVFIHYIHYILNT